MWKLRTLAVGTALLGTLILGSLVAHGGWYWNARVDVGGEHIRTFWTTESPGGVNDYHADIGVTLPQGVDARLVKRSPNEDVSIGYSGDLGCTPEGVEARVAYLVSAMEGEEGATLEVAVRSRTGDLLGGSTGTVGEPLSLNVFIPGATC